MLSETSAQLKQEQAQFEVDLKECRLSLDEIHDKALEAAQDKMAVFKHTLEHELDSFPHRTNEILTKAQDTLGFDYKRYRFREDDTKESLLEALSSAYGKTQDGKGVYDYLFKGYYIRLRQEYFKQGVKETTIQEQQSGESSTYLEPDLLLTIHAKFNGKLWDSVSGARFISVFTYDSKATLKVKDDKKELVCGLLKRMYDNSNTHLHKKDWAKPLLDKLKLRQSTFEGINNKLLGKKFHEQTKAQRPFMKDLNIILPPKANSTY